MSDIKRYPPGTDSFILERVDIIRRCADKVAHKRNGTRRGTIDFVMEEVTKNGKYCDVCQKAVIAAWELVVRFSEFIKSVAIKYGSRFVGPDYCDDIIMDAYLICFMVSFTFDPADDPIQRLLNYYGLAIRHRIMRRAFEYKSVKLPTSTFWVARRKVRNEEELEKHERQLLYLLANDVLQVMDSDTLDEDDKDEGFTFVYARDENTPELAVTAHQLDQQMKDLVKSLLPILTERERLVLIKRYGLDGEPLSLRAVGEILGISRERVRQIEVGALRKLRRRLVVSGGYKDLKQQFFGS